MEAKKTRAELIHEAHQINKEIERDLDTAVEALERAEKNLAKFVDAEAAINDVKYLRERTLTTETWIQGAIEPAQQYRPLVARRELDKKEREGTSTLKRLLDAKRAKKGKS